MSSRKSTMDANCGVNYAEMAANFYKEAMETGVEGGIPDDDDLNRLAERMGRVTSLEVESFTMPHEYKYLLREININDGTILKNERLTHILTHQPTNLDELIDLQIALISLQCAQDVLDNKEPLFENVLVAKVQARLSHRLSGGDTYEVEMDLLPDMNQSRGFRHSHRISAVNLVFDGRESMVAVVVCQSVHGLRVRRTCKEYDVDQHKQLENEVVRVFETTVDFVPMAMLRAVHCVKRHKLSKFVLPDAKFNLVSFGSIFVRYDFKPVSSYTTRREVVRDQWANSEYRDMYPLNHEQFSALHVITSRASRPFPFVLFGPPGTGKTHTIAAATFFSVRQGPDYRVLVCTPSNAAADRIAEKLMEFMDGEVLNAGNVLRMVSAGADFSKRSQKLDPIVNVSANQYKIPCKFDRYRVIVCTLASSAHLVRKNVSRYFFTHIIIDEAGQASEPEVWLPIGGLANKTTQVVLCGDPKQLGPVIPFGVSDQFRSHMNSPLVRYMDMPEYQQDCRLSIQLRDCYRCHHAILTVASRMFYEGTLRPAGDDDYKNQLSQSDFLPVKGFPVLFVNVRQGAEERDALRAFSCANRVEAEVVARLAQRLVEGAPRPVPAADIGVISPYRRQAQLIGAALRARLGRRADALAVDSVERFQGSERRVVLLSCTRTADLGFMACPLRLNTSITRAQQLLIVIGKRESLARNVHWNGFIEYCEAHGSIIDWKEEEQTSATDEPENRSPESDFVF